MSKYTTEDLRSRQALPLDAKITMAKKRIKDWHDSWIQFGIKNQTTGKVRYSTKRSADEVKLRKNEVIESARGGANLRLIFRRQGFYCSTPLSS